MICEINESEKRVAENRCHHRRPHLRGHLWTRKALYFIWYAILWDVDAMARDMDAHGAFDFCLFILVFHLSRSNECTDAIIWWLLAADCWMHNVKWTANLCPLDMKRQVSSTVHSSFNMRQLIRTAEHFFFLYIRFVYRYFFVFGDFLQHLETAWAKYTIRTDWMRYFFSFFHRVPCPLCIDLLTGVTIRWAVVWSDLYHFHVGLAPNEIKQLSPKSSVIHRMKWEKSLTKRTWKFLFRFFFSLNLTERFLFHGILIFNFSTCIDLHSPMICCVNR